MNDARNNPEKYLLSTKTRAFSVEQERIIKEAEDPMCTCGDRSSMHIDGCEQCFNGDCGCKVFEDENED